MTTKLYPEYRELVSIAIDWEYGATYTHEEIAAILGIPARTPKYYSSLNSANKNLLDAQKMLVPVKKIGYRVAVPAEYTKEVVRQIKLSNIRSEQAVKVAAMAPIDKMTLEEQMRHRQLTDRAMSYRALTSGTLVESQLLLNKK